MTSLTVTDLDDLIPDDKQVKLGGKVYTLPGDLPMEVWLKLGKLEQESDKDDADNEKVLGMMVELLVELFTGYSSDGRPEAEVTAEKEALAKLLRKLGVATLPNILKQVYGALGGDEEDPSEAQAELPPGTTKSSQTTSEDSTTTTPPAVEAPAS
jgi:hypothetical protein